MQRIRRHDDQATPPEPHTGLQGEGGDCRHQGHRDQRAPTIAQIEPATRVVGAGCQFEAFRPEGRCRRVACLYLTSCTGAPDLTSGTEPDLTSGSDSIGWTPTPTVGPSNAAAPLTSIS
jgi:hypothetical protein